MPATLFRLGPTTTDRDKEIALAEIERELQRLGQLTTEEIEAITLNDLIAPGAAGGILQSDGADWQRVDTISYSNLPTGGGTWTMGGELFLSGGTIRYDGALLFGHTSVIEVAGPNSVAGGLNANARIQVVSSLNDPQFSLVRYSGSTAAGGFVFTTSRSATPGVFSALQSTDRIVNIVFSGDDGTDLGTQAARIVAEVDGAVSTNRIPGRVSIWTAAGTSDDDIAARWRFVSGGHFLTALDNVYDIGAAGATRPRSVYVGTLVVTPRIDTVSGTNLRIQPGGAGTAGMVGIHTGNPQMTLSVVTQSNNDGLYFRWPSTTTGHQIRIGYRITTTDATPDTYFFAEREAGGPLALGWTIGGTERWRITSAGILQANGAQTLQASTGQLTLATAAGDGAILLSPHGTGLVRFTKAAVPDASDGAALGSASLMWSDLFLASGAVINFNNGTDTLTHGIGGLNVSGGFGVGGDFGVSGDSFLEDIFLDDNTKIEWGTADVVFQHFSGSGLQVLFGATPKITIATASTTFATSIVASGGIATSASADLNLSPNGTGNVVINSSGLRFNADNSEDIGAAGALRPRRIYVGTGLQIGTQPDYTITNPTTLRSLDVAAATLAQVAQFCATMAQDFIDREIFQ